MRSTVIPLMLVHQSKKSFRCNFLDQNVAFANIWKRPIVQKPQLKYYGNVNHYEVKIMVKVSVYRLKSIFSDFLFKTSIKIHYQFYSISGYFS